MAQTIKRLDLSSIRDSVSNSASLWEISQPDGIDSTKPYGRDYDSTFNTSVSIFNKTVSSGVSTTYKSISASMHHRGGLLDYDDITVLNGQPSGSGTAIKSGLATYISGLSPCTCHGICNGYVPCPCDGTCNDYTPPCSCDGVCKIYSPPCDCNGCDDGVAPSCPTNCNTCGSDC